jgi:hypothetical protein
MMTIGGSSLSLRSASPLMANAERTLANVSDRIADGGDTSIGGKLSAVA